MIIKVKIENKKIEYQEELEIKKFKDWGLLEKNIEDFIVENIDSVFDDEEHSLIVVGRQAKNKAKKINDLLMLDSEGCLVLVEIKRDEDDMKNREALEFQAIRYAASLATIKTPEELIRKILVDYIAEYEKHKIGDRELLEVAREKLNSFIKNNNIKLENFNQTQKIRLVASSYDATTLSACAWLIDNGMDMKLIQLTPLEVDGDKFIRIDTILPQVKNEDFYVEFEEKSKNTVAPKSKEESRNLPKMRELLDEGLLKVGDKLYIKGNEDEVATVINSKLVNYKGESITYNEWGTRVKGWQAIQIYVHAFKVDDNKSLQDIRYELLEKRNTEEKNKKTKK